MKSTEFKILEKYSSSIKNIVMIAWGLDRQEKHLKNEPKKGKKLILPSQDTLHSKRWRSHLRNRSTWFSKSEAAEDSIVTL